MAQFQCKTEMSLGNVRKSKGIQEKCEIQVNFFPPTMILVIKHSLNPLSNNKNLLVIKAQASLIVRLSIGHLGLSLTVHKMINQSVNLKA